MACVRPMPTPNPNAMKFTLDISLPERLAANHGDDTEDAFTSAVLANEDVASVFGVNDFVTVTPRRRGRLGRHRPHGRRGRGDVPAVVPRRTVDRRRRARSEPAARSREATGDDAGGDPASSGAGLVRRRRSGHPMRPDLARGDLG